MERQGRLTAEVKWLKPEKCLKVFCFIICQTYEETVKKTWEKVMIGFSKVVYSWSTRNLDTLSQRAEVAKTFSLSKLYYVAQVLPLNEKYRKQIETSLSNFIFKGRHEKLKLSELTKVDLDYQTLVLNQIVYCSGCWPSYKKIVFACWAIGFEVS